MGSHPEGCRRPAPGDCRWTLRFVEASSGPESYVGFFCNKKPQTEIINSVRVEKKPSRSRGPKRLRRHANRLARMQTCVAICSLPTVQSVICRKNLSRVWIWPKCMFLTRGYAVVSSRTQWEAESRVKEFIFKLGAEAETHRHCIT